MRNGLNKTDFPANLITREAVEHIMAKVELTIPVGLGKWHKENRLGVGLMMRQIFLLFRKN